ncbi:MAG: siphovirus Gp157 family protein [Variibacter sp.]
MDRLSFAGMQYQELRRRLLALDPDLDDETLTDTLEGLTDVHQILAATLRASLVDESLALGMRDRIANMEDRLAKLEERALKRRQIVRDVMVDCGIRKIADPEFTLSTRPGIPALIVLEESAIPPQFWEPREPRLNRKAILADLKQGIVIPGATLSNPEPILSVRTK